MVRYNKVMRAKGGVHMEYRVLGKTGLKVSLMGFGGIPIQRVSFEQAEMIISAAIDRKINFIDTARAYTDSESKIGNALKGKREKVILATKSAARTYEDMKKDIDMSLKTLETDYIDLYQCHNVRTMDAMNKVLSPGGALEALREARDAGKIGYIGVTGHNKEVLAACMKSKAFSTVQFPFNYMERDYNNELLPLAKELDMGTIIMKPLAGGAFTNVDLALKYLLNQDVSTIIPGTESVEQVNENAGLLEFSTELTSEESALLEEEAKKIGDMFCRRCDYCKPCPQGIDVADIFIIHGYYERYNLHEWASHRYRNLKVAADACIECGLCESRCPYNLPIREMLKKVHKDMG